MNEPIYNERYLPSAGRKLRPAAAAGIRVSPAVRLGVSCTYGPYLGKSSDDALPRGSAREDFKEVVLGFDGHFSQGHFELWTEVIWNSYEVPTISGYPVRRDILLKASYRRDHWPEAAPPGGPAFPDGHALAVQGSWLVDLGEVLRRKY